MHFQMPPHQHAKIVSCLSGEIYDVIVDLRIGSPTFCKTESFYLSGASPNAIYIPSGCAHGFYTLSAEAMIHYLVSTEWDATADFGINWASVDTPWPLSRQPIVSERDHSFPAIAEFSSPFVFERESEMKR